MKGMNDLSTAGQMTKTTIKKTERGFKQVDFEDLNGDACSIQESSLATEAAIWLGQNKGTHHHGECLARMHLNQKQVKRLLPMLKYFVKYGELPSNEK